MAVQLLAGLARAGAVAARSGAKKLAISKAKSVAKDKIKSGTKGKGKEKDRYQKPNFKPGEGGTDSGERHLQAFRDFYGLSPSSSPLIGTTKPLKIKPAKSSDPQVKQLKVKLKPF